MLVKWAPELQGLSRKNGVIQIVAQSSQLSSDVTYQFLLRLLEDTCTPLYLLIENPELKGFHILKCGLLPCFENTCSAYFDETFATVLFVVMKFLNKSVLRHGCRARHYEVPTDWSVGIIEAQHNHIRSSLRSVLILSTFYLKLSYYINVEALFQTSWDDY